MASVELQAPIGIIGDTNPDIIVHVTIPSSSWDRLDVQIKNEAGAFIVNRTFFVPDDVTSTHIKTIRTAVPVSTFRGVLLGSTYNETFALNDAHQIRVRASYTSAQNGNPTYTAWSDWSTFEVQSVPSAPTLFTPSATTLTPTIQGTYNQGEGDVEDTFQFRIIQSGITIYDSGDVGVTISTGWTYGDALNGDTPSTPPALNWGSTYSLQARSKDTNGNYSPWSPAITWTIGSKPTAPTNIQPGSGSITDDTTPTITWQHNDPSGNAQSAVQIELFDNTAGAFVTDYNPKTLSQSTQSHTVTTPLTLTHQYLIRIRTQGFAPAGYGPYSPGHYFTVAEVPVATLVSPVGTITDPPLTVSWTFEGESEQTHYKVTLYNENETLLWDSGWVEAEGTEHIIDPTQTGVAIGGTYWVRVRVRDEIGLEGDTGLVQFTINFTPPTAVSGVTVEEVV